MTILSWACADLAGCILKRRHMGRCRDEARKMSEVWIGVSTDFGLILCVVRLLKPERIYFGV